MLVSITCTVWMSQATITKDKEENIRKLEKEEKDQEDYDISPLFINNIDFPFERLMAVRWNSGEK